MISNKQKKAGYLSFEQSILITLGPAFFFLLNGSVVLALKSLEAAAYFYFLLPLIFIFILFLLNQKHHFITIPNLKKFLPIYIVPVFLAITHSLYYGTSYGGDSSSYFTNPIYTFYESGVFSHLELPFVTYGKQPLASYWLPYNSEFIFAGIGSLFGLKFFNILFFDAFHIQLPFCPRCLLYLFAICKISACYFTLVSFFNYVLRHTY